MPTTLAVLTNPVCSGCVERAPAIKHGYLSVPIGIAVIGMYLAAFLRSKRAQAPFQYNRLQYEVP